MCVFVSMFDKSWPESKSFYKEEQEEHEEPGKANENPKDQNKNLKERKNRARKNRIISFNNTKKVQFGTNTPRRKLHLIDL